MSGLSRTPGKRVRVNSPPRVRIPPSPPNGIAAPCEAPFLLGGMNSFEFIVSRDL